MLTTRQPQEHYQAASPTSPTTPHQQHHQQQTSSHSPSPSRSRSSTRARNTLGDKITALGAKLSRTLGHASVGEDANDPSATATAIPDDRSSVYSNDEPRYTRYTGRGSIGLTRQRTAESDASGATAVGVAANGARSVSRGREAYSTGRGGAGNIRQPSLNANSPSSPGTNLNSGRTGLGPDDFSITRGREPVPLGGARGASLSPGANGVYSTGRGGAGNLRSPSRDADAERAAVGAGVAQDQQVIREYVEKQIYEGAAYSTGRGGAGNITSRSRSKSQTRDNPVPTTAPRTAYAPYVPYTSQSQTQPHPQIFSTGRGGAGNIVHGDVAAADVLDGEERRRVALSGSTASPAHLLLHSTGRGGGGNITAQRVPPVESVPSVEYAFGQGPEQDRGRARGSNERYERNERYESHGRGGAGNMSVRGQTPAQTSRSRSRARE